MTDVRRPKEYEQMLYDLCQSEGKIFNSYKEAMVFAACLGYSKNEKTEFSKSSEPIGMHIFHAEFDEAVFYYKRVQKLVPHMKNIEAARNAKYDVEYLVK